MDNYLAIDLGDKRVWIARNIQNIAFAHKIVPRVELISYLKETFKSSNDINGIVVGLPYDLYGKDLRQLNKTQDFIQKLQNIFPDIHVYGHDERYSSFLADQDSSEHRDDIAAQHILQSFLDTNI